MGSSYQQQDVVSVWDEIADSYDNSAIQGPDYQAYLQIILECVGNPYGRSFCEVGCGSGIASALLCQMGARVTLVDISPKSLWFAKKHFESLNLHAGFALQDGLQTGFCDGTFDVAWNGGVIEHFVDQGKVLLIREMWRIVQPGGLMLIKVPNAMDFPFMVGKFIAKWRGTWAFGYEDDLTVGRLAKLARRAGLQDFDLFAYNPIVGWWFLPYGKVFTQKLGLNTVAWHAMRTSIGHVICLLARKPINGEKVYP